MPNLMPTFKDPRTWWLIVAMFGVGVILGMLSKLK